MFNFFKKKKSEDELWFAFFNSLNDYCAEIDANIEVNCNQCEYYLEYCFLSFPHYYQYEEEINRFKELPYKNMYEVLNIIYSKANINPIDIENAIENDLFYDFLHIRVTINITESLYFKVFFVTEDNGRNTYRILYHQSEFDTLENIAIKIQDMLINFSTPYSSKEPKHFLEAMVALAKHASIEIPIELEDRFPDLTVVKPVIVSDFERVIKLVNLSPYEGNVQRFAKELFDLYIEEKPVAIDFNDFDIFTDFDDTSFSQKWTIISSKNLLYCEKFDHEEAEAFINDLLIVGDLPIKFAGKWTFNYPEETYGADLFPYIQKSLEKIGMNLMCVAEIDKEGYNVFLVKTEDVEEILELSRKLALGFEKADVDI